jgi:hypothetical protein
MPKFCFLKCRNSGEQVVSAALVTGTKSHAPPLPGPLGVNTTSVESFSRL